VDKIVVAGERISVFAGPIETRNIWLFDDYHRDAKGSVIAVIGHAKE
jgi:hypothetical protein